MTRYEGIFAPGHAWRASVVPGPKTRGPPRAPDAPPSPKEASAGRAVAEHYIPWAELLRRTYGIDPELCECGAKMRIDEVITEYDKIRDAMVAMGLSATPPPRGRKRTGDGELSYLFDE